MKFAREYEATLEQEQFPQHWIQSSISYRQLKKCIRQIQIELSQLGLDAEAVEHLLQSTRLAEGKTGPLTGTAANDINEFKPNLVFLVRIDDGDLVDATLSRKAKDTLRKLVGVGSLSGKGTIPVQTQSQPSEDLQSWEQSTGSKDSTYCSSSEIQANSHIVSVQVPLRNNDEFFQILQHGLSGLKALQGQEKTALGREIGDLGQMITRVAKPAQSMQRTDLYAWRAIFSLYLDSNVFFSTNEKERFSRSPTEVQCQLQLFSSKLVDLQKNNRFRRKDSNVVLQRFLLINANLLRSFKFQQLNMRAAGKILKKIEVLTVPKEFDKRTSLGAQNPLSALMGDETLSPQIMAKFMCSQLSNEILAIVPQLNDYLCPVCFSISYKPVRLTCGHVFCIRCMVVMQRSRQTHCPLCRGDVVMQADSANLDLALMNFLKTFFPREVKQKQKDNERNSAIDRYGSDYERTQFKYWKPEHDITAKYAQGAAKVDWKELFRQRHLADGAISHDLGGILSSQTGRIERSERIIAYGYRYYSDAVLGGVHRARAIEEWVNLREGQPVSLERALAAFDQFVLHDWEGDLEEISARLDNVADSIRAQNPEICELSPQQKAELIARYLIGNNFTGIEDDSQYHNLQNSFIGLALQSNERAALPLISVAIFCALSKRLGLIAEPCGFPFHIYAIVTAPEGRGLDGRLLQNGLETQRIYMDPFRSDKVVSKSDLEAQLRAMGIAPIDHEAHLSVASTADMVRRTSRNIIAAIQSASHIHGLNISTHSANPESDGALYSALWALLVLPEDNAPHSSGARYLPYIVDHVEKQFLIDVPLIEKFTNPLFEGSHHEEQLRNTVRVMRRSDLMPKPVKPRDREKSQGVQYKVGQVFRHKRYNYQGVITGWDVECAAGETWMSQMGVDRLSRGRHQSFYHVLVEDKSVRYVAEENIDDAPLHVGTSLMSLAGRHFKRWDGSSKVFVSNIKDEYPDD
ncbi:MAG: hypothetical protein Q9166_000834 [cf. Caloplaca sp. 2 TL-2023]